MPVRLSHSADASCVKLRDAEGMTAFSPTRTADQEPPPSPPRPDSNCVANALRLRSQSGQGGISFVSTRTWRSWTKRTTWVWVRVRVRPHLGVHDRVECHGSGCGHVERVGAVEHRNGYDYVGPGQRPFRQAGSFATEQDRHAPKPASRAGPTAI